MSILWYLMGFGVLALFGVFFLDCSLLLVVFRGLVVVFCGFSYFFIGFVVCIGFPRVFRGWVSMGL